MNFLRKKRQQGGDKKPRKPFFREKVSKCHKIFSVVTSLICSLTMLTAASLTIADAADTSYDVQGWMGIAIGGIVVSVVQFLTTVVYAIPWRHAKRAKYAYHVWAIYHLFASLASLTFFFLGFYLVPNHSEELQKNFWAQFKLKLEKANATVEDMMIFIDFAGFNFFFSALIVLYPKVSKIWNRNASDDVDISLN